MVIATEHGAIFQRRQKKRATLSDSSSFAQSHLYKVVVELWLISEMLVMYVLIEHIEQEEHKDAPCRCSRRLNRPG